MTYRILSFNLRTAGAMDGKHNWSRRQRSVVKEIRLIAADVLGLQEITHGMMTELKEALPEYEFLGVARDDGHEAGEYSPVVYLKDRFKPIEQGHFWLSETPDTVGAWGWDAACIRIATWAVLEDLRDQSRFFFLNTHTDHEGINAREESSILIRSRAASLAQSLPIIITGDFNAAPDAKSIRLMTAHPTEFEQLADGDEQRLAALQSTSIKLHDSRSIAELEHLGPDFTFHDYKLPELLQNPGKYRFTGIIDYIFVSSGVRCVLHAASTDMAGELCISDHLPIIADLLI